MKKDFISVRPSGSEKKHEPKVIGEVLNEYFRSDVPLAVALSDRLFKDFFPNTEPCCQLKLLTRKPGRLNEGTMLDGIIVRNGDECYVFVENAHKKKVTIVRRNPVVFSGGCVNVHRLADGTLRLEFNHPKYTNDFTFQHFCREAAEELLAVAGLVEK